MKLVLTVDIMVFGGQNITNIHNFARQPWEIILGVDNLVNEFSKF